MKEHGNSKVNNKVHGEEKIYTQRTAINIKIIQRNGTLKQRALKCTLIE